MKNNMNIRYKNNILRTVLSLSFIALFSNVFSNNSFYLNVSENVEQNEKVILESDAKKSANESHIKNEDVILDSDPEIDSSKDKDEDFSTESDDKIDRVSIQTADIISLNQCIEKALEIGRASCRERV